MFKKSMAVAFLLLGLAAACATAGVPRVVVLEKFGATW
jgi:hypothetical protein